MTDTVSIGCFREIYRNDKYPSIIECIHDEAPENKPAVLNFLKRGRVVACAPGIVTDVMTGERVCMELTTMTDEEFEWRSDLIYYYERYNVDLPGEFTEKAIGAGEREPCRWYKLISKSDTGYVYAYSLECRKYDGIITYSMESGEEVMEKPSVTDRGSRWREGLSLKRFYAVAEKEFPEEYRVSG